MLAFYLTSNSFKTCILKFPNDEGYDSEALSYLNYIDISGIKPLRMAEGEPGLNIFLFCLCQRCPETLSVWGGHILTI